MGRRVGFTIHRHAPLSVLQRSELLTGPIGLLPAFASDEERRIAWEANRDSLIAEAIERHPGSRPWAFWRFEADREEYLDEPDLGDPNHGALMDDGEAESVAYLASIGELTEGERRELRRRGREAAKRIGTDAERVTLGMGEPHGPDRRAMKMMEALDG